MKIKKREFDDLNFKEGFRGAHIPKSIMKIKNKEFDELKQRAMTVLEYKSQFTYCLATPMKSA